MTLRVTHPAWSTGIPDRCGCTALRGFAYTLGWKAIRLSRGAELASVVPKSD